MTNQAGIRLAVIDTDSSFLTVLGKRLEGAGWEHRVLAGSVPVEELVAKVEAISVGAVRDLAGRILSSSAPTVATVGPINGMIGRDKIAERFGARLPA